ncbi:MAG TPA: hypothetical protein PK622_06635 [Saprospiraceae bacterium]|nr:hypothetical protein [Saprospiraceae bacterium]HUN16467.1 hypothetical protein [Saprospiraceae bacterium]
MSDQLKAFIQQHKSEFDDKRPDPNLFDKIISEMDANSHNNSRKIIFLPIYKKMIAAASIALILCSAVFLYLTKDQNKTDRNTLVVEQLPTVNRDDVNVESITVTPSIIQEKQVPFIKKFKKSFNTSKYNSSSQTIPYGLSSIEHNIIVQTPALTTVSAPINNTKSISLNKPKDFNTPIENKPNISNSNNKLESQIPTKEIANIDNSELSKSTENISTNYSSDATNSNSSNPSIRQYLRAKFYSMVSRKASKWTNKALQIKATESEDETNLAIQFKSDKLNFNKSISFPILEQ